MSTTSASNITSAFIDLATFDELEKYIYGGPDATAYFVKQVRKATWFSIVPVVLSRTGNSQFGSAFTAVISRAGDYLLRAWLRVQIPAISMTFTPNNSPHGWDHTVLSIRWTRNLMHNLCKEVSLSFNDLVEARLDNYFLDFWSQFTVPAGKRNGYANMIGNFEELTNPLAVGNGLSMPQAILNLPLPFSHFRESGLALPTAALPYNEMKMQFAFREWYELLIIDNTELGVSTSWPSTLYPNNTASTNGSAPSLVADVWAEYALVSNMERVQMGKAPRDMLIEQVQTAPMMTFTATTGGSASNMFNVHFAHAVKALFFGVRNTTNVSEWSNYTAASPVPGTNPDGSGGVNFSPLLGSDPIASTSLFYENTQRLSNMGSDYFSLIQPWYTAVSIPLETGYHMYSYSLDLLSSNPLGSTNYGKLTNVSLLFAASTDAIIAAASNDGTLVAPSAKAPDGAGITQTYQAVVLALNKNIIRIAGGALGFPVL